MTAQQCQERREIRAQAAQENEVYAVCVLEWPFRFRLSYKTPTGFEVSYKVAVKTPSGYCDCPSFPGAYRQGDTCKHVKYLRKWIAQRQADEALLEKLFGEEDTPAPVEPAFRKSTKYGHLAEIAFESPLSIEEVKALLGPELSAQVEILDNVLYRGQPPILNGKYPTLVRSWKLDLATKQAILKKLAVG